MTSPFSRVVGVFGALLLVACSVRLGTSSSASSNADTGSVGGGALADAGGPDAPGGDASASASSAPSCTRLGDESRISAGGGTSEFAWVWDTDHYLVVYSDPTIGNGDIFTLRMAADGTPLAAPVAVESTDSGSHLPDILTTSQGYLVAWEEGTAGQVIDVHALDGSGAPVGSTITVAVTNATDARPVLSLAPNGYAVAWMDDLLGTPSVDFAFLDASLNVTGPAKLADNAGYPWVAGDANGVTVLYSSKAQPNASYDVHAASLGASPLSAANDVLLHSDPPHDLVLGRRIVTGYGYLSAWEDENPDDNEILMALSDHDGNPIAQGEVEEPGTGDANWPHMADNGTYAGVVYYQWRASNPQIFVTFIDASGKRVFADDMQVSSTPSGSWARFPDVQWDGSHFGVAWVDTRDGSDQLYFARVSCPTP